MTLYVTLCWHLSWLWHSFFPLFLYRWIWKKKHLIRAFKPFRHGFMPAFPPCYFCTLWPSKICKRREVVLLLTWVGRLCVARFLSTGSGSTTPALVCPTCPVSPWRRVSLNAFRHTSTRTTTSKESPRPLPILYQLTLNKEIYLIMDHCALSMNVELSFVCKLLNTRMKTSGLSLSVCFIFSRSLFIIHPREAPEEVKWLHPQLVCDALYMLKALEKYCEFDCHVFKHWSCQVITAPILCELRLLLHFMEAGAGKACKCRKITVTNPPWRRILIKKEKMNHCVTVIHSTRL